MKTEKNTTQVAGQSVARNNYEPVTHKFDHLKMYFGEPFDGREWDNNSLADCWGHT